MTTAGDDARRRLWIALVLVAVLLGAGVAYGRLVWNKVDFRLFYVPSTPLFWAFVGGSIRVLHGLLRGSKRASTWLFALVRPIIGATMGAFVYLALVSGLVLVGNNPVPGQDEVGGREDNPPLRIELLCVLAFVAGYSDRFSFDLLERIAGSVTAARGDAGTDDEASAKPRAPTRRTRRSGGPAEAPDGD